MSTPHAAAYVEGCDDDASQKASSLLLAILDHRACCACSSARPAAPAPGARRGARACDVRLRVEPSRAAWALGAAAAPRDETGHGHRDPCFSQTKTTNIKHAARALGLSRPGSPTWAPRRLCVHKSLPKNSLSRSLASESLTAGPPLQYRLNCGDLSSTDSHALDSRTPAVRHAQSV